MMRPMSTSLKVVSIAVEFLASTNLRLTVLRRLLSNFSIAIPLIATLLFVVHPVHTEVVANIKSRDEILSLLFTLFSLSFLLKASDKQSKLQSFPIPGSDFKYSFHADLEFEGIDRLEKVLEGVRAKTDDLKILGVYKKGSLK